MNPLKRLLRKSPQMNLENNKTLFVGLWNPQDKYSKTRHNIGADILIRFCKKNNLEFKLDKNSIYNFSSAEINGSNVEIILPMVSMNNSGDALKSYFKYNNKENTEVVVVHDDIDLASRLRNGKGGEPCFLDFNYTYYCSSVALCRFYCVHSRSFSRRRKRLIIP